MQNKTDKEYRTNFDYLNEMKKFTRKDMLLLSLYQEWINTRYNKSNTTRALGISIFGIFFGALALTYNLKEEPIAMLIMFISSIFLLLSAISILKEYKNEEKQSIDKLNAIRTAINSLSS